MPRTDREPSQTATTALTATGVVIGVVVAVLASDVILGVIAGAAFIAIAVRQAQGPVQAAAGDL